MGNLKFSKVKEGQPCPKCGATLVKRTPKHKKFRPGQNYAFEWYIYCPGCKRLFMVEEAKYQLALVE